jgi:hypothetical protein
VDESDCIEVDKTKQHIRTRLVKGTCNKNISADSTEDAAASLPVHRISESTKYFVSH